jgi:adenylyltransferase/sulfurtransferase
VDAKFDERFSRHYPLNSIGKENQRKLKFRSALIAGMGGLGTSSSSLLSSIGVGNFRIVDYDVVERSNLPRQDLYFESDIGKAKVDVAEERLRQRNPYIKIDAQATRIDAMSSYQLLDSMDCVIDGLDTFTSRKILHRASYELRIPFIFAGAIKESANVMTFTHDRAKPCLECVLGNVQDNREMRCEIAGVHPAILQLVASIQVSETVRVLLGQEPLLSTNMLFIDLESLEFERVSFTKREDCRVCGFSEEGELDKGKEGDITRAHRQIGTYGEALVTSLCGRNTLIVDPAWNIEWDFPKVKEKLKSKYHLAVDGNNYATVTHQGISVSLLSSGVATIRGTESSGEAINAFAAIMDLIYQ